MKSNRLFIVDDEPGICRVLSTLFIRAGWEVVTFNNPSEALKAVPGSDVPGRPRMWTTKWFSRSSGRNAPPKPHSAQPPAARSSSVAAVRSRHSRSSRSSSQS